jgi:hypothetical protein
VLIKKHNESAPLDTKTKIMHAAFELFGRHGFVGTSVRQIAQASEVNLAAVNYHFKNKENLFWEIMTVMFFEVDKKVAEMAAQSKSTLVLSEKIYDFFIEESLAAKNTMKMMLSEDIVPPIDVGGDSPLANPMGPPGGQHLAEMIQKDIPFKLSREGALWGVKSIFGSIFHWALLVTTDRICNQGVSIDPLMTEAQIKKDVMRMVDSTLFYMIQKRESFIDR